MFQTGFEEMTELPIINQSNGVQDASTCRECGGVCCQRMAGLTIPSDFGEPETLTQVLVEYLLTGFWAVDWWEGDPREDGDLCQVYFIRPAHTNAIGKLRDPSWGGTCRLWSETHGCSLQLENRPFICRMLEPEKDIKARKDTGCNFPAGVSKTSAVIEWIPYQNNIREAMDLIESGQAKK